MSAPLGVGVAFHLTQPTINLKADRPGSATGIGTGIRSGQADYQHTMIADTSMVMELNDLRKKLDKREIDMVRKDKQILDYYNQNQRLHKELSVLSVELESLKERNEQLQQALISTRLAAEQERENSNINNSKTKIKALESALQNLASKQSMTEEELAKSVKTNKKLQFELGANTELLNEGQLK